MLSNVINDLVSYGNYIFFSVTVIILLCVVATLGVKFFRWKSLATRFYGAVTGVSAGKLVALALILLRMLFFWSVIIFNTELQYTHVFYGILLTVIINILLSDVRLMLFDLPCTSVVLGMLYSERLLREYLMGVRFQFLILIMMIVIIVYIVIASIIGLLLCIGSVLRKNSEKHYSRKLTVIGQRSAVIMTGLLMAFVPYFYMSRMDTLTIKQDVYQYTAEGKKSYNGVITITRSGLGCTLENRGKLYGLGSTPLYYVNENRMLLPSVTSIVQPKLSLSNRIANMSLLYENNGQYYVENEKAEIKVSDFFLYDGKDTYSFFEPITVTWNKNSVNISPLSYVVVKYNQTIDVYDREKDIYSSIDTGQCNALVTMKCGATVNMSTDVLSGEDGQEKMLYLQPNLLEDLK